jgi:hypothetical protein
VGDGAVFVVAAQKVRSLLLRDIKRVCSLCHHKGQRHHDLAGGIAAPNYHGCRARIVNSMTYAGSRFRGEAAGQVSAIVRA